MTKTTQRAPEQGKLTVSIEEAAALLGICRSSAYQAARTGEIPTIRIGKRMLVPWKELERLLSAGSAPETKQKGETQ